MGKLTKNRWMRLISLAIVVEIILTREPNTGNNMVAVAVFDVISVKNVNIVHMINAMATWGMDLSAVNLQLSSNDNPDS